jgi:hypothetical protein
LKTESKGKTERNRQVNSPAKHLVGLEVSTEVPAAADLEATIEMFMDATPIVQMQTNKKIQDANEIGRDAIEKQTNTMRTRTEVVNPVGLKRYTRVIRNGMLTLLKKVRTVLLRRTHPRKPRTSI